MKFKLLVVGKTSDKEIQMKILDFYKRLKKYINFEIIVVPSSKNKSSDNITTLRKEGISILKKIKKNEIVILLDEKGTNYSSLQFAKFIENKLLQKVKNVVFVIGGAYGFDKEVYRKSQYQLSLSKMTFSHQMVRLFFTEQVYRAFTIINNHPYHNE
tara:strand:+ start:25894 stop:26364 length:471 start_codon:yes stop_codon:yes gene_type:complete